MGDANTIPVEIQLVAVGNAETVRRINEVSNAAKHAGADGFGSLEHFLIRVSGGNRELMMGLRGLTQLMQGAQGNAAQFGAALNATLLGVGVGIGAVAIVKFFEGLAESGKKSFEDAGLSSHGFFEDMAAGLGIIEPLNQKLEATSEILERLNRNLADIKRQTSRAVEDTKGTTEASVPKRQIEDLERVRERDLSLFRDRGEEIKKELAGLSKLSDTELINEWSKVHHDQKMPFLSAAFRFRGSIQSDIEDQLTDQGLQNERQMHQTGTSFDQKINTKGVEEVEATKRDFWLGLQEKELSGKVSGKPDMLTQFLLHNNNATVGGTLDKLGVADPYNKSPEAAEKLLEPLFRGIESQAERLREDALHPHLAPIAVAGSAEAYKITAQYKENTAAETAQDRIATQAQIQTALLQSINTTLANLTVHGGN